MPNINRDPSDTIPSGPPTSPELPEDPIAAGKARVAVSAAFLEVLTAIARATAVCEAVARQLDAGAVSTEAP
jgi:hypothetical protein